MELYSTFIKSIEKYADCTALEWEDGHLTFQELKDGINAAGRALKKRKNGERSNICLVAPNTPYFFYGLMGILSAGHVAVPLNPLLNPEELAALIAHAKSSVLLYDPLLSEKVQQAASQMKIKIDLIPLPQLLENNFPITENLLPSIQPDDASMILYTSGTTGDPKGVILTHRNIYEDCLLFTTVIDFSPADTLPLMLPLFHTFAMTVILFGALMRGSKIRLYPQFTPQKILECIVQDSSVILVAVPPMFYMLARFAPDGIASQHHIRMAVSGGGPLPMEASNAFQEKFNHEILEGYGLTETSPVVSVNLPGKNKPGTIGPPLPGVEVQVRDNDGNTLGCHEVGELCVRGKIVMQGYYRNPEATQAVFYEDGWFRTGDLARIDEEGYMQIVGRAKDLIVCGGENIYPREIEETLLRHPAVAEAAVVGRPHRLRSETPFAFIVLNEDAKSEITESELRKHCRAHLAEYKIPEGFSFIEEMPKTATRKIQKEELKKIYFNKNPKN
ncbi:MAG: AMP-binding protein [Candidatus Omnitrophota bacterium]